VRQRYEHLVAAVPHHAFGRFPLTLARVNVEQVHTEIECAGKDAVTAGLAGLGKHGFAWACRQAILGIGVRAEAEQGDIQTGFPKPAVDHSTAPVFGRRSA